MSSFAIRLWYRLLRRLGTSGMVGLALLASATLLAMWAPRLQHNAAHMQQIAEATQRSFAQTSAARGQVPSTRQQLQEFSGALPLPSRTAADLMEVFAAAQRNRVTLAKGEYQLNIEPNGPVVTYTATFPVKEHYGRIKDFAADLLRSLPHAALEDLRLERSDAGSPLLDARIRIAFVYRGV